ncbi:hypothetical protein FRX31_022707 [Thalictrum thalictroides]|uniref:Uncharacterized protein n=1 Tax=Thalictrum thalictroides TaxID=46969 RepID=A0A7J6VRJ0_THATH|nr:hypothetical protein FRX31_022707 [Thalictrum thalictroides]
MNVVSLDTTKQLTSTLSNGRKYSDFLRICNRELQITDDPFLINCTQANLLSIFNIISSDLILGLSLQGSNLDSNAKIRTGILTVTAAEDDVSSVLCTFKYA